MLHRETMFSLINKENVDDLNFRSGRASLEPLIKTIRTVSRQNKRVPEIKPFNRTANSSPIKTMPQYYAAKGGRLLLRDGYFSKRQFKNRRELAPVNVNIARSARRVNVSTAIVKTITLSTETKTRLFSEKL